MKANELRIGNLVSNFGQHCFVMNIYKDNKVELGYFEDSIGFVRSLDDIDIKPILLTEEWLLNFGFEKLGAIVFQCDHFRLLEEDGIFYFHSAVRKTEIKFVHQLQNLYFALTGNELILKS